MGTIRIYTVLKNQLRHHDAGARFLYEFMHKTMLRFCSIFLVSACTFVLKILGFISKYLYRSKSSVVDENGSGFSVNRSRRDDQAFVAEKENFARNTADEETEDSVFARSDVIARTSKYEFVSGKNISAYIEEPETIQFVVGEMFVGSDDVHVDDRTHDPKNSEKGDFLEPKLEGNIQEADEKSGFSSFSFTLFDPSWSTYNQEHTSSLPENQENTDIGPQILRSEEVHGEETEKLNPKNVSAVDGIGNSVENIEDQDFSYEVELLPDSQFLAYDIIQESEAAAENKIRTKIEPSDTDFLDLNQQKDEDLDDEYIELEPRSVNWNRKGKDKAEDLQASSDSQETNKKCLWDYDEEEEDVLLEHQNLVQQMKMELKNCSRIKGLPTISEESESPKVVEDLKPLKLDHKFEYKDIVDEIQRFYKCYSEKMRKLDILNYQTLHALSFLQLKDSEVFKPGKKNSVSAQLILPKLWPCKVQRIYADPANKSINEMHCDLELVYVGQLCLSWEILSWLYVKARELREYDIEGNHSYNRVAEEFQQFQVLMRRFMEDEPFQGHRIQNYVKNRSTIRGLLQVPTIKDDCLKDKKEQYEETDAISLEKLIETMRESMLIFQEFLWADKRSTNVIGKGINGTKVDVQDYTNRELLVDIIANLQKKERRVKQYLQSQNCIVKKLKKPRECRLDNELLASQVELRLVSRVLSLSRLTTDQLVWCQNKLGNISFSRRKVHVEPSFLLFPS